MKRRRFMFWVGMGLFSLSEKLQAAGLDELAAAMMDSTEGAGETMVGAAEHWTSTGNRTWRWFERESLVDGEWKVTGITTPFHKRTGEPYVGHTGYLPQSLVPEDLLVAQQGETDGDAVHDDEVEEEPGKPDARRRARHGRPPSKWLRSLHADELHIWLATIEVPETGVSGMTFLTHLTRDHMFDPAHLVGLSQDDQAKLHSAAHHGY
jgi:hypothetical protein